MMYLLENL